MKNNLGRKIITKFCRLRVKTYSYLIVLKSDHKEFIKNNKLIVKIQLNKINLSSNDDKRMQLTDLTETHAYAMSKDLVTEKEEIKCTNIINRYKNYEIW